MLNIALVCKYVAHMGHRPSGLSKINLLTCVSSNSVTTCVVFIACHILVDVCLFLLYVWGNLREQRHHKMSM